MSHATQIVESLGIDPAGSVSRAINEVGMYIAESGDKLLAANTIILGLSRRRESKLLEADIVAKCLVERVLKDGDNFDGEAAYQYAREKVARLIAKMPEILMSEAEVNMEETTQSGRANKNNNTKKEKAKIIYDRMKDDNTQSAIAKAIAEELEISFANAFYYVNRVFK